MLAVFFIFFYFLNVCVVLYTWCSSYCLNCFIVVVLMLFVTLLYWLLVCLMLFLLLLYFCIGVLSFVSYLILMLFSVYMLFLFF